MTFEKIPTVETYRGVPIHDRQGPARIAFVRRQIDAVVDGDWTLDRLAAFAGDGRNAPEARLLAADVVQKYFENRRFERQAVPFDVDNLIATVAALDSAEWRCPDRFTSLIDPDWCRAVLRDEAIP